MTDSSTGGLLAFIVAVPAAVICFAGKAAPIGIALFGKAGFLSGATLPTIALVATLGGIMPLAARSFMRKGKQN